MHVTPAESQLIHILRAAADHDFTIAVRVRDGQYTVCIATHDGGPGEGSGCGDSFDAAWFDVRAAA